MLQSIWDDIRREFDYGNMISRIIIVNAAIYLFINLAWVFLRVFNGWETPNLYLDIRNFLAISNSGWHLLTHPWSIVTHMFLHEGFWHILWNMLFLFWFGRIFGDLLGDRRVLPLYILGGLAGAVFFYVAANLTGFGGDGGVAHYAFGASAAVMCILVATGVFAPDYSIRLFLLGNVRLKYIVAFVVIMNVISLGSDINTGGAFGHIGGITMGFLFAWYLKRGTDLTQPVQSVISGAGRLWNGLLSPSKDHPKRGPHAAFRGGRSVKETATKERPSFMRRAGGAARPSSSTKDTPLKGEASHQEQLDAILDKIKERGYNSLSKDEKEFLFRASNRN
ncbi:membrane associated rhomboid family serine protease [Lewinella aquimaris]|uniref:Membrane associated rhomboid family serine protease n=1 Tax=Neolewinella aquimaris TaxID=1835722 RepID=A0A840E9Q4_9BACT|nr:rhomboid family intramembrane serine protease [Neolewinella aquimaris]MBB4080077.1 membrane associated rhomboid family serine protease [Neolewinella aquimaris]